MAPPEYATFTILQEFWTRFGWTEDDLKKKPKQQVAQYIDMIRLIQKNEEIERSRAARGK